MTTDYDAMAAGQWKGGVTMTNPTKPDAPVEQRHIELATRLNALCSGADWQLVANFERDATADLERRLADAQRALVMLDEFIDWINGTQYADAAFDKAHVGQQVTLARAAMAEKGEGNG